MPRSSSAENQDDCIRTIDKLEARIKRLRYLKQDLAERLERQAREVKEREQENEELWRLHREKLAQMEREKNTVKADLAGLAAATKRIREKQSSTQKGMLDVQKKKHNVPKPRPFDDGQQQERIVRDLRHQHGMAGQRSFEHRGTPRGREPKRGEKSSRPSPPANAEPTSVDLHVGKAVMDFLNMR